MRAVSQPSCGVRLREPWIAACTGALALPNNSVIALSTTITQRGLVGLQDAGVSGTQFSVRASRLPLGSMTVAWMFQGRWEGSTSLRLCSSGGTKGLSLWRGPNSGVLNAAASGYTWNPTTLSMYSYSAQPQSTFVVVQYDHTAKTVTAFLSTGASATAGALSGSYTRPTDTACVGEFGNSSLGILELASVADGLVAPALIFKDPWGTIFEKPPRWLYTGNGSGSWTPLEVAG